MNVGLYTSASGLFTSMFRMDTWSNNLANVDTPGFKADFAVARLRAPVRQEDGLPHLPSNDMLERLASGTLLMPTRTSFSQGELERTGNPLDLAIDGDGFLAVRAPGQRSGESAVKLTRDGRLTLSADGRLVTSTDGLPVLDAQDRPITLRPGAPIEITSDGSILQDGAPVATLQFVDVRDRSGLDKDGQSLYRATQESLAGRQPASGRLRQFHLESSSVNPVSAMMGVSDAASAAQANTRMIQLQDELLSRLISTFARVA